MTMNDRDTKPNQQIDRLYQFLLDEEDARVCTDIPEESCSDVPRNFIRIGAAQTLTRLADELANAKTVLPWLLAAAGASSFWVGFLVPIRESMSMLPQLFIAGAIRRRPLRKQVWLTGAVLQSLALIVLAFTALFLRGPWAGAAVLLILLLFSLARGLCSVASKDVVGKTIPKTRRGRLNGFSAAVSGVLTLAVGLLLVSWIGESASPALFAFLLFAAAALWLASAWIFSNILEQPGATQGGKNAVDEALKRLDILRTDRPFRRFVLVRALLLSSALAGPYYIMLAGQSGAGGKLLGFFVLASGLASALSSAFWGRFSDRSSRSVLIAAAAIASSLGLLLFIIDFLGLLQNGLGWITPIAFFLLAIAHSGIRIGRKTYILDMASGERRTDYVAVSNTVIGAVLLLSGSLGALAPWIGASGMLLLLSLFGFAGVILGIQLPEAE
ncbi:MAG: MFS transporter [Candidatus Omnitrophica bacterium]|nr:MFS transporter [Candidatus Omnitrophota bacterium]